MQSRLLIIFGAGGHGKSVLDVALAAGRTLIRVLDDQPARSHLLHLPVESASGFSWRENPGAEFLVAIGDNNQRRAKFEHLLGLGGSPATLIHPRACVSAGARIGAGSVVMAGAVVNVAAQIGANCIVNTLACVEHDCLVADHCHVCPCAGLAGAVQVGAGAMIGMGARILPGIQIGAGAVVGAGAVANRAVPPGAVGYGVPVRLKPPGPVI